MKTSSPYPSLIFRLALLVLLEQMAHDFIGSNYSLSQAIANAYPYGSIAESDLLQLLTGILIVIGGWLAGKAKDVRTGMMSAIAVMLVGSVLANFSNPTLQMIGMMVANGANWAFLVLCFLQVAVLYPFANDWKDNAFLLLLLALVFSALPSTLTTMLLRQIGENPLPKFLPAVLCLGVIGLVVQFKDIGFTIESQENAEEEQPSRLPWEVLGGVTLAATIVQWGVAYFSNLGVDSDGGLGIDMPILGFIYFGIWLLIIVYILLQFRTAQAKPRQLEKFGLAIVCLLLLGFIAFLNNRAGSYEVLYIVKNLAATLPYLFVFPILLSVLTHVNFDWQAGLWLGILMGVPQIAVVLTNQLWLSLHFRFWVMPVFSVVLLVLTLIFLRENKSLILSKLNLEDANQEVEEPQEKGEDPIDHLIG